MNRPARAHGRKIARAVAVAALTAVVAVLDGSTGAGVDASFFYFLPIVLACSWFGEWGVLLLPVTVILSRGIEIAETPAQPHELATDLVRFLSFSLIAGLTLLARLRYEQVVDAQRAQETLRRDAETRGKQLEALYRVATAANASRAAEEFLSLFLDEVGRLLPQVRNATVLERVGDVLVRRAVYGSLPASIIGECIAVGRGISGRVAATGEPLVIYKPHLNLGDIASPAIRATRPAAAAGVPLVLRGDTVGALLLFADEGACFGPEELRAVHSMAAEAALVLESLNLYESLRDTNRALSERQRILDEQLSMAREVQQAILSVSPSRWRDGPIELAGYHTSAWEVGGDFLRIMPCDDGVAFFVGDVMGRGVPAALLMTMMTATLSASEAAPDDAAAVLREANRVLLLSLAGPDWSGFVTAFYAHVERGGLRLRYASAGHPPPLLVRAGGEVEPLPAKGIPLGISPGTEYPASERSLGAGDRLVLYTDGVSEARDAAGEQFGYERLEALVAEHRAADAEGLQQAIVAAVRAHQEGSESPTDDMAVLVLAVHPEAA